MGVIVEYDNTTKRVLKKPYTSGKYDRIQNPYLRNPDLTGLVEHFTSRLGNVVPYDPFRLLVPWQYWKVEGDTILGMTQAEQDAIDAEAIQAQTTNLRENVKKETDKRWIKAVLLLVKNEINILRSQHGLPERTNTQLRNALRNLIDNGDVD